MLSLLSTPLTLLTPLPLKIAVDSVLGSEPLPEFLNTFLPVTIPYSSTAMLVFATSMLVAIAILGQLQELGNSLLRTYTAEKLVLDFRARLFRHVQRLSLSYHDLKGTSDSTYRIQYDTSAIQYIAIDSVIPFITASFTLVSMLYIIFRLDWQLALVALAVSPVLFTVARIYRRQLRHQSRQVKKLESAALSVVQEVLTALRVVKAFGQEDREQERFVFRSDEGVRARISLSLTEGGLSLLLGLTTAIGTAAVLFIGVRNAQAGALTLGELLLVMGYISQLYSPLKTISRKIASLQSHLASAERVFALLDEATDVFEKPDAQSIPRARGTVELRNVSFSYDGAQSVLADISFNVPAGTRVGIAGKTGAGKTTLVSLLTRFYDPTTGQIFLDGVDLRNYKLTDLRNQFSIVLQEPVLFSTSIAENIAYARPDAGKKKIIKAAKAANAHEFIVGLPDGYDTLVGERGMRFSGGERQRIALARAFLKNAPILILDEPTSSVDMATETGIMEAMERLIHGRTTFMIAHRLSTLENCDVLLVLEDGQLVDVTSDVSTVVKDVLASGGFEATILGERVNV
ncbi:MAG TPA: ABC transporter ATP-binding protein [Pyrinomonadaceae bacterium]|nr:ABC transporter ATP-binding protein [Pyrinomonadaceae bacterium]